MPVALATKNILKLASDTTKDSTLYLITDINNRVIEQKNSIKTSEQATLQH